MNDNDMNKSSETNWVQVDALAPYQIDTSDSPPLLDEFFLRATWRKPAAQAKVTLSLDADVLLWFQDQGETWQQQINAALRIYVEAHKEIIN